jgi:hypothetical protein
MSGRMASKALLDQLECKARLEPQERAYKDRQGKMAYKARRGLLGPQVLAFRGRRGQIAVCPAHRGLLEPQVLAFRDPLVLQGLTGSALKGRKVQPVQAFRVQLAQIQLFRGRRGRRVQRELESKGRRALVFRGLQVQIRPCRDRKERPALQVWGHRGRQVHKVPIVPYPVLKAPRVQLVLGSKGRLALRAQEMLERKARSALLALEFKVPRASAYKDRLA